MALFGGGGILHIYWRTFILLLPGYDSVAKGVPV
jgi:hypothetical protein